MLISDQDLAPFEAGGCAELIESLDPLWPFARRCKIEATAWVALPEIWPSLSWYHGVYTQVAVYLLEHNSTRTETTVLHQNPGLHLKPR